MTKLILASRSPARLATLHNAGIQPLVRVSEVDEDALEAGLDAETPPPDRVTALARAKAVAVADSLKAENLPAGTYLVLGCDSMLEIDGQMVGKPHTPELARQRIRQMRETDATLWTGHSLIPVEVGAEGIQVGNPLSEAAATIVHFASISDAEIDAYVATGEPLEVAGSFTIDGLGGPFVKGVTGDPHSVVGVSLPLLRELVARVGVFWPSLWTGAETTQ